MSGILALVESIANQHTYKAWCDADGLNIETLGDVLFISPGSAVEHKTSIDTFFMMVDDGVISIPNSMEYITIRCDPTKREKIGKFMDLVKNTTVKMLDITKCGLGNDVMSKAFLYMTKMGTLRHVFFEW